MQEDVEQKTLMLIVNGSKFTGRLLKAAITKYMAYRSTSPPKYMIFFKGRDADAITAAFQEYMGRKLRRETRTSVLERLEQYKDMARNTVEKVRKKVLER